MPPARIIPPLQADERATLTGFLDAQRATLADRIRSTDARAGDLGTREGAPVTPGRPVRD